ncbi:hypothetical protein CC78DRAFT_11841 [Lojkania enalia]|uniref:Uncharacterized protein n=1 Tax=Lojkania enalia TaxID=147567 RepID=A0A9P4ND96_9PLEO|nr:hypothetical protein CC78DRAFT_11841 [Didymosphaeria enalia]
MAVQHGIYLPSRRRDTMRDHSGFSCGLGVLFCLFQPSEFTHFLCCAPLPNALLLSMPWTRRAGWMSEKEGEIRRSWQQLDTSIGRTRSMSIMIRCWGRLSRIGASLDEISSKSTFLSRATLRLAMRSSFRLTAKPSQKVGSAPLFLGLAEPVKSPHQRGDALGKGSPPKSPLSTDAGSFPGILLSLIQIVTSTRLQRILH